MYVYIAGRRNIICNAELIPQLSNTADNSSRKRGSPGKFVPPCNNGYPRQLKHPIVADVSEVMLRGKTITLPHLPQTFQGNPYLQL